MKQRRVFFLFEHGVDLLSYCSGHMRFLRPLTHPSVHGRIDLRAGHAFDGGRYDAVIVERFWKPNVDVRAAEQLIEEVRQSGAQLIFATDDNLFDLRQCMPAHSWHSDQHFQVIDMFATAADAVLTSTEPLKRRMAKYNRKIVVIPNMLDERLIARVPPTDHGDRPFPRRRLRIGYMGTRNHDEDFALIAPALRAVWKRHRERVDIQLIGVVRHRGTLELLQDTPIRAMKTASDMDYPLFLLWFTSRVRWDIGLAPLLDHAYANCKSDIKLLDYSSIGAAGIYSRVSPYADLEARGLGLVVENSSAAWEDALERLIADAPLRARIAENGWRYLWKQRTLERAAPGIVEAIEHVLDGKIDRAEQVVTRAHLAQAAS